MQAASGSASPNIQDRPVIPKGPPNRRGQPGEDVKRLRNASFRAIHRVKDASPVLANRLALVSTHAFPLLVDRLGRYF
jgi:hypothetical protein